MSPVWTPGETVLTRFVRGDGSIGGVHPLRVLADDGESLIGWLPMGTEITAGRLPDGRDIRSEPLQRRFRLGRRQVRTTWHGTSTVRLISESNWSSVFWFFDAAGTFRNWYVNLEVPCGRTERTLDRMDGALDVEIDPDRCWRWKDEDEVVEFVAAGRITERQHRALRAEGERMIALAEAGAFPFDGSWCDFRPDPAWPAPRLPAAGEAIGPVVE
jgi:hypothetical protein